MRLRLNKTALPRWWIDYPLGQGIVYERDIAVGTSRLRAKLLIFSSQSALRKFWKEALSRPDIGPSCPAAVNTLLTSVETWDGKKLEKAELLADPRYFCVIGITRSHLRSCEVGAHEAVHAGFAYAKRVRRTPWDTDARKMDEEWIAYPAGKIMTGIARAHWKLREREARK